MIRYRGMGARGASVGVSDPATVDIGTFLSTDPMPAARGNVAGAASDRGNYVVPTFGAVPVVTYVAPTPSPTPTPTAPASAADVTTTPTPTDNWFTDSMFAGIPNWGLVAAGGGALLLLFMGGKRG